MPLKAGSILPSSPPPSRAEITSISQMPTALISGMMSLPLWLVPKILPRFRRLIHHVGTIGDPVRHIIHSRPEALELLEEDWVDIPEIGNVVLGQRLAKLLHDGTNVLRVRKEQKVDFGPAAVYQRIGEPLAGAAELDLHLNACFLGEGLDNRLAKFALEHPPSAVVTMVLPWAKSGETRPTDKMHRRR